MKKKDLKGLKLHKKLISNLNKNQTVGGGLNNGVGFTDGCTDGCTPFQTFWNCSKANCTSDCPRDTNICSIDCSVDRVCSIDCSFIICE